MLKSMFSFIPLFIPILEYKKREEEEDKEAESLLTPHHCLQLVRWVWALPGWPARVPGPQRPAGFCSPEPACGQMPTSAADSPPSARSQCSAGPAASY